MRGLTLLLAIGLAASDKLDRTYLPPPGAKTSGGDLGTVDAPFEVPEETPSTTIRSHPKYPVRPEDTKLTVGINRGQPTTVTPEGFTTPGPFSPTYIPSTTTSIAYTQTTTFPPPEGFETTVSPIGPTVFPGTQRPVYGTQGPTLRPVYGPDGQVIGVTTTPATVEVCEEGNGRCQIAQQVGQVYGPKGQVVSQQPTVAPTQGPVQDLRSVYGPSGEIIGVTPIPGSVEVCKEGDERCQKQAQQNVPVYGPSGQIISYLPSVTPSPGIVQRLQPAHGPNGQTIGQQPVATLTPETIQVCKEGDSQCLIQGQQVPVYGPNGQIVGYQPSFKPTLGTVQSPRTQGQQTIPVYGPNGEIVGYQPSVVQSPGVQPIYGPLGQIIGQQPIPTPSSVQICNEADERCLNRALENVPVYDSNGKIIGYQPTKPTSETLQSSGAQGQQIIPVYVTNGENVGYQPSTTPTSGPAQNLQPVYDSKGKIIEYRPTGLVQGCKEGDLQCQKQAQQYIPAQQSSIITTPGTVNGLQPVYDSNGKIIEYRPTGLVQGCKKGDLQCQKQAQQYTPVYGNKQQPSVTSTPGTVQGLQPVYDSNGKLIDYRPIGLVQGCKEEDLQCQKQAQQFTPVFENRQQPTVTPTPGFVQGVQPVYDSNGKTIEYRPTGLVQGCNEGDVQCQKQAQEGRPVYRPSDLTISQQPSVSPTAGQQIVPVYGPNGQIIGQRPALSPTPGTVQALQSTYSPSGQYVGQQPTPGTAQICQVGDENCKKQYQQNVPVYGPNGQIVGYQPSVTPTPGSVQTIQPTLVSGQQFVPTPTQEIVLVCQNGVEGCQKQAEQNVPVYGPNEQIVGYQPGVITAPGAGQNIQPVYDSNGKVVGYRPTGLIQSCKEGDVQCQKQTQQVRPVYGPNGQIVGYQPGVIPSPETVQSLRPVYGPDGKVIAHTPTVASRPVYGGKVYQPGSTVKPPVTVTTPSYYRPSSLGTTPAPFRNFGTTPAGVVISTVGADAERPLAESDKKAVTINYDVSITPDGYSYNFDTSNGIHVNETGIVKPDGNKAIGSYSYIGDDGKEYHVSYEADENGFKPTGHHLPTPPPIPPEIQRVIEQAAKDKQAGISDDGSYDEAKYGPHRYDQPQLGEIQRPTTGRKPSKQSYDKNIEPEEGYQYAPPEPKFNEGSNRFPPRLPGRDDSRRPPGSDKKYTKQPFITPNVHRDNQDSYEEGPDLQRFVPGNGKQTPRPTDISVSDYHTEPEYNNERPGSIIIPSKPKSRPNVTTYRPSGIVQPGQVDKYGRPISSQPGEVIGSTTYRPSERPQSQVDKFGRPITQQPGEYVIDEYGQPIQVDEYGRPTSSTPGQGYSSTTYRPTVTGQPTQVDKFGRPISGTAAPGKGDEYERPTSSRPGQGYSSTTYRPTVSGQPAQVDKFGRPIYSQPKEGPSGIDEQGPVDAYVRPTTSGKGISTKPTRVDKFGRPIYSRPEYEPSGSVKPEEVDKYGRPVPSKPKQIYSSTTYRPTETPEPVQIDAFGRPISPATGQTSGIAEPVKTDQYGRLIPSRPSQGYSTTTYRPTGTSASGQVDAFGRPEEFGPKEQRVGPEYLSPREDKNRELIGEDFRGPKQPQRYDPKTGYHY